MSISMPIICAWIPFILNSLLPRNATLGGYFYDSDDGKSTHLYLVRIWENGELVPVRQAHSRYTFAIHFRRGTNDYIKAERSLNRTERGEILTCDNRNAQLRWMKYEPTMDLESCIPFGTISSGETGYVGRTFVRQAGDPKTYGSIPGLFVPSDGFITVFLGGLLHSTDIEILCIK